jgi:predicted RNA-binding protein with PIN domain
VYSYHILIDGYNLINQIPDLLNASKKSIDFARDMLLSMVQAYCDYNNAQGTIVYDGNQAEGTVEGDNPTMIFSRSGETADSVIESLIYRLDDRGRARVVTDDRQISNLVSGMGAFTMSTSCFNIEANQAIEAIRRQIEGF